MPSKSDIDLETKSVDSKKKIAPKELKELKRVFNKLCNWSDKYKIKEKIKVINEKLNNPPLGCQFSDHESNDILLSEKSSLELLLEELNASNNKTIRVQDTAAAFRSLGKKVSKREVLDMMWEVDEKLDNVIDWDEFLLMFSRNINDESGLEPSAFYHMVQFMIYDCDDNGKVSVDETMNMLYARVGREKMESMISLLFGEGDGGEVIEEGYQGGEIDFCRYWEVVEREQIKVFEKSELGQAICERKKSRRR